MELDSHELAWAAGFFDGEGCTFLGKEHPKGHHRQLSVSVAQRGDAVLHRFQRAVGGLGKIYPTNSTKRYWQWIASRFEHAQFVIAALWPYLSAPKREQAAGKLTELASYNAAMRAEKEKPCEIHGAAWSYKPSANAKTRCRICASEAQKRRRAA